MIRARQANQSGQVAAATPAWALARPAMRGCHLSENR
jgi:hypothetical protein